MIRETNFPTAANNSSLFNSRHVNASLPTAPAPIVPSSGQDAGVVVNQTQLRDTSPMLAALYRQTRGPNIVTPTRTLRLLEAEMQASSPGRRRNQGYHSYHLTAESLSNRPRSNPHSRVPMRYESPLDSNEFRNVRSNVQQNQGPYFGTGIDLTGSTRITATTDSMTPITGRSNKQDLPSHRKFRRWNNDNFIDLASELSSSSVTVAEVLRHAAKDAHLYRSVHDPTERKPSKNVEQFLYGSEMKDIREQFFNGESTFNDNVLQRNHQRRVEGNTRSKRCPNTVQDCMNRIDPRLRRVLVRACRNSYAATKVTTLFEEFVVGTFASNETKIKLQKEHRKRNDQADKNPDTLKALGKCPDGIDEDWWSDLLVEKPTVTERKDGSYTAQFFFDEECNDKRGSFHRLLLQAVAQFHGLHASSQVVQYDMVPKHITEGTSANIATACIVGNARTTIKGNEEASSFVRIQAKALNVFGKPLDEEYKYRLVPHLESMLQQ